MAEGAGSWTPSAVGGFGAGSDSFSAVPLVEYGGKLYTGTMNEHGAQVWRMKDDGTWESVTTGGFGDSGNLGILRMQVFGGCLYAGTLNLDGCGLWRYDGSTWTDAMASYGPGFGHDHNIGITAMEVFDNKLYAGTMNYRVEALNPGSDGGEIWSSPDGTTWTKVMGQGIVGSTAPGFGDPSNVTVISMEGYAGTIYAGTARFQLAVELIDADHIKLTLASKSCELRRKSGSNWTKLYTDGFTDVKNAAATSMAVYGGKLWIGTTNGNLSVAVAISSGDISDISYTSNGLCLYTYDGSLLQNKRSGGFGAASDFSAMSMCVASPGGKEMLLVGVANAEGAGKLRGYDGRNWVAAAEDGFGSSNNTAVSSLAAFDGKTYAGTVNSVEGCEVWCGSPPVAPSISSVLPTSGLVATVVTIKGSAFGDTQGASYVKFNNKVAVCTGWTDTEIETVVPAGATSGKVTVTTSVGTSNGVDFNVIQPPHVSGISPSSGPVGAVVAISGTGFGSSRGASYVKFNKSKATTYHEWTASTIKAQVPPGATSGGITVTTAAGTSNGAAFSVKSAAPEPGPGPEPATCPTWYLAEGSTAWGFDTYISIENPNPSAVHAQVTYMTGAGPVSGGTLTLPAMSQTTVNPGTTLGEKDFSTKIVCTEGKTIAVDRTMSWSPAPEKGDKHCSIGVTSPAKAWYLPEGSSAWGFECWLLIQNPNPTPSSCTVTYMIEGEGPLAFTKTVPANSRASFNMEKDIGKKDASIKVECAIPVIPERAMYRNERNEGHDSIGTTSPALDYYLAEGTTDWGFTTYVLVQNPNPSEAQVTLTYMTPGGPATQAPFSMPANSRKTIRVNDALPGKDLSTRVHADMPIIAERAMYWDSWQGEKCHDSIGMSSPHTTFYLPDGDATMEFVETWTLVQNPNDTGVVIEVSYLTPTGDGNKSFKDTVPANSRKTYSMADRVGGTRAAVIVTSKTAGKKIMAERAMYWGDARNSGTDTIGGYSDQP